MVTQPLSARSKVAQIAYFTGDVLKAFNAIAPEVGETVQHPICPRRPSDGGLLFIADGGRYPRARPLCHEDGGSAIFLPKRAEHSGAGRQWRK